MQVLNSPSREEVDRQHARSSWLGIGVPSVHNAFRVSKFKTLCWLSLLLTSIPIHLLFNSTIFVTDYNGSKFHLMIGTENLVNGGTYYPPGASIGLFPPTGLYSYHFTDTFMFTSGYGSIRDLTDYHYNGSKTILEIASAIRNASHWDTLDINQCRQEYVTCHGLKRHRNVLLIADDPSGWVLDNDM